MNSKRPTDLKPGEELRPYPKNPRYLVSSLGRIWGPSGRWLRGGLNTGGYLQVRIYGGGGEQRFESIHVMVLEAFVGPRPDGFHADHINEVRTDNRQVNLRWLLAAENCRRGSHKTRGEGSGQAKLTERDVREIRRRLAAGEAGASIARRFGVSRKTVSHVKRRRSWGWLP